MQKVKKIPQRTCIACKKEQDKKDLLRVVRTPSGEILPDATGKLAGRGAYICKNEDCVKRMNKYRLLNKTFSQEVSVETYDKVGEAALGNEP